MADNAAAFAALQRKVQQLRDVPNLARKAAPEVAERVAKIIRRNIDVGVGPDGKSWQRTAEGDRPLKNAAQAVTVAAIGTLVQVRLSGHHVYHHYGKTRGAVKRPVIPWKLEPGPLTEAIEDTLREHVREGLK